MDEALKFAVENGIIDLSYIQNKYEMSRREEVLKKHKWAISQGKDGFWRTYLPDETKPSKRKLVKRKSKIDIEYLVIDYIEGRDVLNKKKEILFKDLYKEWIESKAKHTNSTSYIKRITADWIKYYLPLTDLINKPIKDMTKIELDDWAHETIKNLQLTKKQYYNMSIIIRQSLEYATEKGYIEENPFERIKINSKMFRKVKKPTSQTQVFLTDEIPQIVYDMIRRFQNNPENTSPLAVLLDFEIGVRIGELIAIKRSDISEDFSSLHIQRQVVREYECADEESTKMKFAGFKVVEYTKTDDGDREVYLTDLARKIIRLVLSVNEYYNYKCEDYIFIKGNQRLNHYAIQARIYRGCESIGIITKTMHKIRKTYISSLIDSGLNIDEIRRQVGHSDERTTYGNYCFNRLTSPETQAIMEDALSYNSINIDLSLPEVIKSNQQLCG